MEPQQEEKQLLAEQIVEIIPEPKHENFSNWVFKECLGLEREVKLKRGNNNNQQQPLNIQDYIRLKYMLKNSNLKEKTLPEYLQHFHENNVRCNSSEKDCIYKKTISNVDFDLNNLNSNSIKSNYTFRFSISNEMKSGIKFKTSKNFRKINRIQFQNKEFSYDLSKVIQNNKTDYEFEIEAINPVTIPDEPYMIEQLIMFASFLEKRKLNIVN